MIDLVPDASRQRVRNEDFSWVRGDESMICYHGVWDEGVLGYDSEKRFDYLTKMNRRGECFYFEFRPAMLFKAAETLELREREARESRVDRRHARYALYVALSALMVDVYLRFAEAMNMWPYP